jgi:hypothetical protein
MIGTAHLFAGAAVGRALKRPWLAFPVAAVSHILLDSIPHLGPHSLFGIEGRGPQAGEVGMAIVDMTIGIPLVLCLIGRGPLRWVMIGSAFFGCLPDLLFNVPPWCSSLAAWPGTAWLGWLHDAVDYNVLPSQWLLGSATQLAIAGACAGVIRTPWGRDREGRSLEGGCRCYPRLAEGWAAGDEGVDPGMANSCLGSGRAPGCKGPRWYRGRRLKDPGTPLA